MVRKFYMLIIWCFKNINPNYNFWGCSATASQTFFKYSDPSFRKSWLPCYQELCMSQHKTGYVISYHETLCHDYYMASLYFLSSFLGDQQNLIMKSCSACMEFQSETPRCQIIINLLIKRNYNYS